MSSVPLGAGADRSVNHGTLSRFCTIPYLAHTLLKCTLHTRGYHKMIIIVQEMGPCTIIESRIIPAALCTSWNKPSAVKVSRDDQDADKLSRRSQGNASCTIVLS